MLKTCLHLYRLTFISRFKYFYKGARSKLYIQIWTGLEYCQAFEICGAIVSLKKNSGASQKIHDLETGLSPVRTENPKTGLNTEQQSWLSDTIWDGIW